MKFGPVPVDQAEGAILAHSLGLGGGQRLRKGLVLEAAHLAALRAAGLEEVTVARLDPGDLDEDTAAARLAHALVPDPAAAGLRLSEAATGRVNIHAAAAGVIGIDAEAVHRLNRIDPAITLATLRPCQRVAEGTLVGTVKIIAYGVDGARLAAACTTARAAMRLHPVVRRSAGLVLTAVPGQAPHLNTKGRATVAERLGKLGIALVDTAEVDHTPAAIAAALRDLRGEMVLILTGSATSDLHDTAPEGLRAAGGQVARFGMPVDPGNLLFLGAMPAKARHGASFAMPPGGTRPVIGLPGCARSPALNGADWVMERIACGLAVSEDDIAGMGLGGLLKEPPDRPAPRDAARRTRSRAAPQD